jgi:hypothetical protein
LEEPRLSFPASLSSPLSCALSDRWPDSFSPLNRCAEVSPERTDAIAASSHPSASPQEEIAITDQAPGFAVLAFLAIADHGKHIVGNFQDHLAGNSLSPVSPSPYLLFCPSDRDPIAKIKTSQPNWYQPIGVCHVAELVSPQSNQSIEFKFKFSNSRFYTELVKSI